MVTAVIAEEENEKYEYVHVMFVQCSLDLSTMRAVPFSARSSLNADTCVVEQKQQEQSVDRQNVLIQPLVFQLSCISIHKMAYWKETMMLVWRRIIPYQFTEVLHMIPSELDEIWCMGNPGGHDVSHCKGLSPSLLVCLLRNDSLKTLLFCCTCDHSKCHNLGIFIFLKNELHHFKAQRISFHLIFLTA